MRLSSFVNAGGRRPLSAMTPCGAPMMVLSNKTTFFNYEAMGFGKVSRQRAKETVAWEVKKLGSIEEYFDKLMRRRHESDTGVINLPRRNFEDVMNQYVKTEEDYEHLLGAFYNYLGHRNSFPQVSTDALLKKALALDKPELAYPLIGNHAELLIHPHSTLMKSFLKNVLKTKEYDQLKAFFDVTRGRYMLQRP